MKLLPIAILLLGSALPGMADFISDLNLGTLPLGETRIVGTTAASIHPGPPPRIIGGRDDSRYVRGVSLDPRGNWGNEIVYQFEISQPALISLGSSSISGDPDFFLLDGLRVSVDPASGKRSGESGIGRAFLDDAPPDREFLGAFFPGTYYLLAEHFNGFDGAVVPGNATFDVTLAVEAAADPFSFLIDLGFIGRAGTPLTFDTFGSSFDTELAIYDVLGNVLRQNDNAAVGAQSEISFLSGLPAGDYYAAVAGNDTTFGANFVFSSGGATGNWVFNYPLGPSFDRGSETGTSYPTGPAGEVRLILFSIADPPESVSDLGQIAMENEPVLIDTLGSNFGFSAVENDTQLGLYDREGFLIDFNDDIDFGGGNFLSRLNLSTGLPAGEYFLSLAGWPHLFVDGFGVRVDRGPQGFSFGGDYVVSYPGGVATGNLPESDHKWFTFTIGSQGVSGIAITDITFNRATNQFTVTWESDLAGPFNIFVGDGAALAALSPAPGNVLPTLGAASVTSPATFTVPAALQGRTSLFLQVTD